MRSNSTNCQDCGCSIFAGKQGRKKFCDDCTERRNQENERKYFVNHIEERRAYQRAYYHSKKLQVTNK